MDSQDDPREDTSRSFFPYFDGAISQDTTAGPGLFYIPTDYHTLGSAATAFGNRMATTTPVSSFTSGMPESPSYQTASVTSCDSFPPIMPTPEASLGCRTDEPTSPLSHTGTIFEMDLSQNSPILERSYSGFESNLHFDGSSMSMINSVIPVVPMAPMAFTILDGEPVIAQAQALPLQNQLLMAHGPSTISSRPSTRNSQSFASIASSQTSQTVPERATPSAEDSVEDSGPSSPASSTGQTAGRDHEYYRRGVGSDGLYHCPYDDCTFPPKQLKCEYHKHIDSHLKPFKCRNPECVNQSFSSVACRLRHEREMHGMHDAKQHMCRYPGYCERKMPGRGFARSFNRGDHERRVHGIEQENTRAKGRPRNNNPDTIDAHPAVRRPSAPRKHSMPARPSHSDDSSTSTISPPVVQRTIDPANTPALGMPMTSPIPIPMANYPPQPFTPASLPVSGPFGGYPRAIMPPVPSMAPAMARRPSMGPAGNFKVRKGRNSPVPRRVQDYAVHRERLQQLVNSLPFDPDQASFQLEQSIAAEFDLLRRCAHAEVGFDSSTGT